MTPHTNGHNPLPDTLHELAARIAKLHEQAEALGVFLGDRELLQCPACGLLEDVTVNGLLVVERPDAPGVDTGLRFVETTPGSGIFHCPACGAEVREPEGEE